VGAVAHAVLPGSGSAGLVWEPAAAKLPDALVLPLPDEPSVPAMAASLRPRVQSLPRPRILVGSSLGALVALELARSLPVDALVLVAAGFGIDVHPSVLARIAANPPGLLTDMARGVLAASARGPLAEVVARDFEARGAEVLLSHMQVLSEHRPEPLAGPPPTIVLWGTQDPGVPLSAHVELALRCHGLLVPIAGAGHLPYLERPEETVRWITAAGHFSN
jgi:pimeloyl-ACP methyl ester carboxylesterase